MSQQRQHPNYENEEIYRHPIGMTGSEEPGWFQGRGSVTGSGSALQSNGVHYEPQPAGAPRRLAGLC